MNPPTIADIPQSLGAAWEVQERLVYHSQPGRFLSGLVVHEASENRVYGESDLPCLDPLSVDWSEELFAGQARTPDKEKKNVPILPILGLRYKAQFSRRCGLIRRDPTNPTTSKGMLEWQALIMDAVERMRDGSDEADAAICGYAAKPVAMRWEEPEMSELSYTVEFVIEISVFPMCRSERGHTRGVA